MGLGCAVQSRFPFIALPSVADDRTHRIEEGRRRWNSEKERGHSFSSLSPCRFARVKECSKRRCPTKVCPLPREYAKKKGRRNDPSPASDLKSPVLEPWNAIARRRASEQPSNEDQIVNDLI